jgi:hypothetical protein
METIMTFYVLHFSYFFHRVSEIFAHAYYIQIFRFFSTGFLKMVFILCDIQVLKGKCYNTKYNAIT